MNYAAMIMPGVPLCVKVLIRVLNWLGSAGLGIAVAAIVVHEADEPNAVGGLPELFGYENANSGPPRWRPKS